MRLITFLSAYIPLSLTVILDKQSLNQSYCIIPDRLNDLAKNFVELQLAHKPDLNRSVAKKVCTKHNQTRNLPFFPPSRDNRVFSSFLFRNKKGIQTVTENLLLTGCCSLSASMVA